MPVLGSLCLHVALLAAALAAPLYFRDAFGQGRPWARALLVCTAGLFTAALAVLAVAAVSHDFRLEYIASYTDRTTAFAYLVTAVWAGQAGSLLFWACVLSWMAVFLGGRLRRVIPRLEGPTLGWLAALLAFFGAVLVGWSNPFLVVDGPAPVDGSGLNPLLRNVMMIFHPPTLLAGYAAYGPPAALAGAVLVQGEFSRRTLVELRHWALIAWVFLSIGNLLGMVWAYEELGWGGYWGWDPVENASFIPWLTGTALLHCLLVERKSRGLRGWSVVLALVTFWLTLLGTYLTRSGIVASVHAFNRTVVADAFALLLLVVAALVLVGVVARRRMLAAPSLETLRFIGRAVIMAAILVLAKDVPGGPWLGVGLLVVAAAWRGWPQDQKGRFRSWFASYLVVAVLAGLVHSTWWFPGALGVLVLTAVGLVRGALHPSLVTGAAPRTPLLVVTVLVLVFLAAGVLFGTLLPVTSQLIFADSVQVGPPWYEGWVIPTGLVLLAVTVGCLVWEWRSLKKGALARRLLLVVLVGGTAGVWAWAEGIDHGWAVAAVVLGAAAAAAGVRRGWGAWRAFRATRVTGSAGPYRLLFRRFGAVVAHVGLAAMCLGFSGEATKQEENVLVSKNQPTDFGPYRLELQSLTQRSEWQRDVLEATVLVTGPGGASRLLAPARHRYRSHANQPTSEAAVWTTAWVDVFLTLGEVDTEREQAWVRAIVTPRLQWIWAGGALITIGGLLALLLAVRIPMSWAWALVGIFGVAAAGGWFFRPWVAPGTFLAASLAVAFWPVGRLVFQRAGETSSRPRCESCQAILLADGGFCHRCGAKVVTHE